MNIHFTDDDWQRLERDWTAWWAGELERPLLIIHGWEQPAAGLPEAPGFTSNLPAGMPADEVIARYTPYLEATRFYADAWPKWWPNFGPGIAAGFLGARVHSVPDTVWFEPAKEQPIAELRLAYDANNPWWRRLQELTRAAVTQWGDRVNVAFTDLGGNLDILASLRTSEGLLFDLYDDPDEVARLVGETTRLWIRYFDELYAIIKAGGRGTTPWAPIWSPQRCYMLQSDFCYMISPEMFERYVLPDIVACCDAMEHGFYHLDGKGELPHLDMLLGVERLRGIQWVPGDGAPPPQEWLPLLKKIRDAGKLCQLFVTPEGARTIVNELGGKGFALFIFGSMNAEEAADFQRELK